MTQRFLTMSVSAGIFAALLFASVAQGQADIRPALPQLDELDEIQKEIERFQRDVQRLFDQNIPNRRNGANGAPEAGQVRWGGLRLKKVTAEQTEKLGLPENEGLAVVGVDANTPAAKAGVKPNDILVKVGNKAVPSETAAFTKLVKEHNPADPVELVVLRDGKEETLKAAQMPVVVQAAPAVGDGRRGGLVMPRININRMQVFPNAFPQPPGNIQNLQLQMVVNGAKIARTQTSDQFTGSYAKDDLKITVAGKLENGQPSVTEITVQQGAESKNYTRLADVPAEHRTTIQRHLLPRQNATVPLFQGFPEVFPALPGFDD